VGRKRVFHDTGHTWVVSYSCVGLVAHHGSSAGHGRS
jgi:hypothetical protein